MTLTEAVSFYSVAAASQFLPNNLLAAAVSSNITPKTLDLTLFVYCGYNDSANPFDASLQFRQINTTLTWYMYGGDSREQMKIVKYAFKF